jgi:beta-lactamase superfamily II metal-dependent hydrolase
MVDLSYLQIWFLNVGHGDCSYIELPNGARMMIDCGGAQNWASKLLKYYEVTKIKKPVRTGYALDKLVISHPHGDHLSDIAAIHDEIGFYLLRGNYKDFIDDIDLKNIDYRKRNSEAVKKFVEVVKSYTGQYVAAEDRVEGCKPLCTVKHRRFLSFEKGMDLNELSWFTSFEIGGQKVLYTGDMTAEGVNKILKSNMANEFKSFVKGTTILKVPHHGRENGCSEEMFEAFGEEPLLCIASDKVLDEQNEGTSNIDWYKERTSEKTVQIDGVKQKRFVLTTRKDKDINLSISNSGNIEIKTNVFKDVREEIL